MALFCLTILLSNGYPKTQLSYVSQVDTEFFTISGNIRYFTSCDRWLPGGGQV